MQLQKPNSQILTVWRLRLAFFTVIPSAIFAYLYPYRNFIWWLLAACAATAFFGLYIFYYPIKYRKLSYSVSQGGLLIHCGVIYTRLKVVPRAGIQYLSLTATPLQRLFGLSTLAVFSAGSTARLPGLTADQAAAIQQALAPQEGGGCIL